jgi:hypothetical protein
MVDLVDLSFPLMYAVFVGLGGALLYMIMGKQIRRWLHRAPVHV